MKTESETPAQWLARESRESDIRAGSSAHAEITAMLKRHGLDIFFWKFETKDRSHWSRAIEDGGHERCPALALYFRREKDLLAQEFDPHSGNWGDDWPLTSDVRADLNEILDRFGYNDTYVSARTFIFLPRSWEAVGLDCLGRAMKDHVSRRINQILGTSKTVFFRRSKSKPKYIFWQSSGEYVLVFENAAAMNAAAHYQQAMERAAAEILSGAGSEQNCPDYTVRMCLKNLEMEDLNLMGLARED